MEAAGVDRLVYSSSAAVYGSTEGAAITEEAPTDPVNPYGWTMWAGERLIADSVEPLGLRAADLRYFNVAGTGWPDLADTAVLNLVPMIFERVDAGQPARIFGDDYPTPDGTCVRDYVHVLDLADAHLAVLDATDVPGPRSRAYNVGTGVGTSVREMIELVCRVAGIPFDAEILPRRPGDPAYVVADPSRIATELGWRARHGVEDIVASAWSAHLAAR
jgi:UDP-glucose 4-epimerase